MADDEIAIYDEVEIEDMTFDAALQVYHYPCPCGDKFEIALMDLQDESNDIAVCPSCSLMIRVIYDVVRSTPIARGWIGTEARLTLPFDSYRMICRSQTRNLLLTALRSPFPPPPEQLAVNPYRRYPE